MKSIAVMGATALAGLGIAFLSAHTIELEVQTQRLAVLDVVGLPIVRTSPDHGAGFDIAGRGLARPDSLIAALRVAADIAARREAARAPQRV